MTTRRPAPDWPSIEREYCETSRSIKEIARRFGVSDTAIRKRALSCGWTRGAGAPSSRDLPGVIVGRGRNLALRMLDELETTTRRASELEALIDMAVNADDGGKAREAALQAVSLKQRADVLKALALASKTFAEAGAVQGKKAERQAAAEKVASKFAASPPPRGYDGRH